MSRHEGVSCDTCLKGNFRGRRYKCLTCYDYDLCASCYEAGATTTRHSIDHPMQCILTRSDFELYYGGEALTTEQSQSFTCPFCGKMGFTETALHEHVNAEHQDSTVEVVCPICATQPGGDPNFVTEDFAGHLALEHRPTTSRDLISFLDEPATTRHGVRRLPHPTRSIGGGRPRRTNMHFSSSSGISSLSPSGRDAVDPIAELLSQLSGVRRNNPTQGSASAQLQQLQMQLQLERQQVRAARQQAERLPRRQVHPTIVTSSATGTTSSTVTSLSNHVLSVSNASGGTSASKPNDTSGNSNASAHAQSNSQLMLTKCMDTSLSEVELELLDIERADRNIFIQDVLLSTLMINLDDEKAENKQTIRERASPIQFSSSSSSQMQSQSHFQQQQSSVTQQQFGTPSQTSSSSFVERSKNEQNEQVISSKRVQQKNSPPIVERTIPTQYRTISSNNRIELMISRPPHQPSSGNNNTSINVREVLAGNNNYPSTDTARRKPICTVDSINQTTEPPTSH